MLIQTVLQVRRKAAALRRQITAYHEAAHAVVAFQVGIPIEEIVLHPTDPDAGWMRWHGRGLITRLKSGQSLSPALEWSLVQKDAEHHVMMCLAGPLAEAKLLRTRLRVHDAYSDLRTCRFLCLRLERHRRSLVRVHAIAIPREDPADMANRLRRRTRRALGRPETWRAVVALAKDLEGWRQLNGFDAADTVQWAKRIRGQLALLLPTPVKAPANRIRGATKPAE